MQDEAGAGITGKHARTPETHKQLPSPQRPTDIPRGPPRPIKAPQYLSFPQDHVHIVAAFVKIHFYGLIIIIRLLFLLIVIIIIITKIIIIIHQDISHQFQVSSHFPIFFKLDFHLFNCKHNEFAVFSGGRSQQKTGSAW